MTLLDLRSALRALCGLPPLTEWHTWRPFWWFGPPLISTTEQCILPRDGTEYMRRWDGKRWLYRQKTVREESDEWEDWGRRQW